MTIKIEKRLCAIVTNDRGTRWVVSTARAAAYHEIQARYHDWWNHQDEQREIEDSLVLQGMKRK